MNILFSGITGNLFNWINDYFDSLSTDFKITILSRKQLSSSNPNLKYLVTNLENSFYLENYYDIVFYASHLLPFENKINQNSYYEKNVLMLKNFLNALNAPPKKFVYVSTNAINELLFEKKKFMYAYSKLLCEDIVIKYCNEQNINFLILRLPPLVNSWKDFSYELNKLKSKICIFPFSKDIKVIFISSKKTFHGILNEALKTDYVNKQVILNFEFTPQISMSHKINLLKKASLSNSFVFFVPIKKNIDIPSNLLHRRYYYTKYLSSEIEINNLNL